MKYLSIMIIGLTIVPIVKAETDVELKVRVALAYAQAQADASRKIKVESDFDLSSLDNKINVAPAVAKAAQPNYFRGPLKGHSCPICGLEQLVQRGAGPVYGTHWHSCAGIKGAKGPAGVPHNAWWYH